MCCHPCHRVNCGVYHTNSDGHDVSRPHALMGPAVCMRAFVAGNVIRQYVTVCEFHLEAQPWNQPDIAFVCLVLVCVLLGAARSAWSCTV